MRTRTMALSVVIALLALLVYASRPGAFGQAGRAAAGDRGAALMSYKDDAGLQHFWNANDAAVVTVGDGDGVHILSDRGMVLLDQPDVPYGQAVLERFKNAPNWVTVQATVGPDARGKVALNLAKISAAQSAWEDGIPALIVAFDFDPDASYTFRGDAATRVAAALAGQSTNLLEKK